MADPSLPCELPSRVGWKTRFRLFGATLLERLPSDCPLCRNGARGGALCGGCHHDVVHAMQSGVPRCAVCRLALGPRDHCPDCTVRAPAFDAVAAAFDYAGLGELLVRQFKAQRRFGHARFLARMLADETVARWGVLPGNTILVPVPASRSSIVKRGFNPAAELARFLAPRLGLRHCPELLVRRLDGKRQTHLQRRQRLDNASGLYACTRPLGGACVAVVDDVMTTGSTLDGIASQLKEAGAAQVVGLVLARTPYRSQADG